MDIGAISGGSYFPRSPNLAYTGTSNPIVRPYHSRPDWPSPSFAADLSDWLEQRHPSQSNGRRAAERSVSTLWLVGRPSASATRALSFVICVPTTSNSCQRSP